MSKPQPEPLVVRCIYNDEDYMIAGESVFGYFVRNVQAGRQADVFLRAQDRRTLALSLLGDDADDLRWLWHQAKGHEEGCYGTGALERALKMVAWLVEE